MKKKIVPFCFAIDLKKDSCILQFDLADGTRLRTKVSTKWTGADAKAYILNKASSYMNGVVNNPADYVLRISGLPSTVSNEGVPLSRVAYVQACTYVFVVPVLEVIHVKSEKIFSSLLVRLILLLSGIDLGFK